MSDTNYILTSDGTFMSEDELCHYGIKGMKWGVRRYQNYDGSYTKALSTIGTMSMSAAVYNHKTNNLGNDRLTKALAGIGALSMTAAGVNEVANYGPNKKLRAYYSHTSSY